MTAKTASYNSFIESTDLIIRTFSQGLLLMFKTLLVYCIYSRAPPCTFGAGLVPYITCTAKINLCLDHAEGRN
jgi:hypothetical protein